MPESSQVHIDAALTNVSIAYRNNNFIAELVAPSVAVRKQSDRYYVYDPEREFIRSSNDQRAPGAEAQEVNFSLSTDSYFCEDHALAASVPDEERENADPVIQPDIDRTEMLTDKIHLNREMQLEALLSGAPGVSSTSAAIPWSDAASDPIADFESAREMISAQCFQRANTVILPFRVFDLLRNHPSIVDRVKYTTAGVLNEELLAQVLDVERILVPRSYKNTAPRGQAPMVIPVWSSLAYMLYVPPRAALKQVSAVYTFVWNGMGGSIDGTVVERWREPRRKADMILVQKYYDQKLVCPGAACRIADVAM